MAANNSLIGALRAEATLESGKFVDGAKKIRTEAQKTEATLKSSFSGAAAAIKGFGGAVTAGLSIGLLAGVARKALDYAQAIGTVAKQLGVTTKELQLFRYAAEQVGVKQAEADKGLERLGVTLGKAAAGSKTATTALGAVGITIEDIKTKSRTEIFAKIADQMLKTGGAAKNAAAGTAIMGDGFSKLGPLLDRGSSGISELSQAAERLGIVLSDRQIQQADETARKLDDVRSVLAAQIAGVVADNASSIVSLANALATLTGSIINFLGSNPQAALGILGALAGSRFGLPGAAAGGIAGMFAGGQVAAGARDSNTDLQFRMSQVRKAQAEYRRTKTLYGGGPAGAPDRARAEKELRRQTTLLNQATAAATSRSSAPSGAAIPQFLAPAAPKGRTARARRGPRDRSDDVLFQFEEEQRRADMDVLRAKMDLAGDYVDRTTLSVQMLDLERASYEAGIQERVRRAERDFAEGKITEAALQQARAQAESLKASNGEADALRRQAIIEEEQAQRQEEAARLSQVDFDIRRSLLQAEAQLAETAAERRDVELRLLNMAYEHERDTLQRIIRESKDYAEIEEARRRLAGLPAQYEGDRAGVIKGTRGPLEEWAAGIPQTAARITEAFQRIQVDGLEGLGDAITDVITGTKNLKDAFGDVAKSIVADLIRMSIRMLIFRSLSAVMGGGFSGGFGAFNGGIGGGTTSGAGGFGDFVPAGLGDIYNFARGGSFQVLGRHGTDRNVMSINGLPIANVSRGERVSVSNDNVNDGSGKIVVHQTLAPHFAGNAATRDDLLQMAQMTKASTIQAIREERRRA